MSGLLRVVAITASVAIVWFAAAARLTDQTRLPVAAVVQGATVTQPFGCTALTLEPFDPSCPSRHVHTGIDLAAPAGTAVHSATAGVVHVGEDDRGPGLYVAIQFGPDVRLLYCHLLRVTVTSGQVVTPGQVIGAVGESGLATGPHVHFEVQVNGRSVDPSQWLAARS